MTIDFNALSAAVAAEAAVTDDMNVATAGGGGGKLWPSGQKLAIMVEYFDLGMQPQEYNGKPKDPAPEFQLGFLVFGTDADNPAEPYLFRTFSMSLSRNEKSGTFKSFKAMNYRNDSRIKHFAQFLGQAFILNFEQYTPKGSDKPRMKLDLTKTAPPINPLDGSAYPLPQVNLQEHVKYFLWNNPALDQWDSMYVDGQWDDGSTKNRLQGTVVAALNFDGSPIHQLLLQSGRAIPQPYRREKAATPATPAQPAAAVPATPVAQPAQVAAPLAQPAAAPVSAAPAAPLQTAVPSQPVAQTVPGTPQSPSEPVPTPAAAPTAAPAAFAGIPGLV